MKLLPLALIAALAFLLVPLVAGESQIAVLSVVEGNDTTGGVADIFLTVRPGSGGVYIDSYPLTRLDTQLSARFAREYACMLAQADCSRLDFFYVIRARSTIIGGPSAGAAMTVLAYAELNGLSVDRDSAITGTIGSGGIVGPVGGTAAKVRAARDAGYSTAVVSALESDPDIQGNGVEVVSVVDVEEAIRHFTGRDPRPPAPPLVVPAEYHSTMLLVSESLCERASLMLERVGDLPQAEEQFARGARASASGLYYSAASHCFSAGLTARQESLSNRSQDYLRSVSRQLSSDIQDAFDELPDEFDTLADLEVYMIVRERLVGAQQRLEAEDMQNLTGDGLAYAIERFHSARAWSAFFGAVPSRPVRLTQEELRAGCWRRLAEAEERLNYITYLTRLPLPDSQRELATAYSYEGEGEYALCLFSASKARAEADSVISAVYAGDNLNRTISLKLDKAGDLIARATQDQGLPILSYSYFEYASDLEDSFSRNLYAEYALSLATLDLFFPLDREWRLVDSSRFWLLLSGIVIGFTSGVLFWEGLYRVRSDRRSRKSRRKKR